MILGRFFGTFALVAMEHIPGAIHFLPDSSEQIVVLNAGFRPFSHGAESC